MSTYIHFTEDQKYRANSVDLEDFLRRRGEKLLPSGREKRLADDHSITVRGNQWYDHSAERGGYAIDFAQRYYKLSFPEAVTLLLGGEQGEIYRAAQPKRKKQKKPFELPSAHSDMRRVFAYLVKTRQLDGEIVRAFVKEKLLYESYEKSKDRLKEYHNAVFVGLDEHGVARHAHKHGLYTEGKNYKGNVDGSDPAYSFHYLGTGNRLYVFEAPIDMLSYITLRPRDWHENSYVALCGLSEQAMLKTLETNPRISHVRLCLDNDNAGQNATEKFAASLSERGCACDSDISRNKDWNDDLIAVAAKSEANEQSYTMNMK